MNPLLVAVVVFACVFGAAVFGVRLRSRLPEHHLGEESKDAVRIGMGLVATMAALILGLLVASTKGTYDSEKGAVTQMAAKIIVLDRVLDNYGPEARSVRQELRRAVESAVLRIWPEAGRGDETPVDPGVSWGSSLPKAIQKLIPQDDAQRTFKTQAAGLAADLAEMRWLIFEQAGSSISRPLLIVVIVWLAILFGSIGLFAPSNSTVFGALMLAAFSVSGAIFLIMELDQPFDGLVRISNAPMTQALNHLGAGLPEHLPAVRTNASSMPPRPL
jgi:hypothetical protein